MSFDAVDPRDFGSISKRPAERLALELDFTPWLSSSLLYERLYRANEYVLPTNKNGFVYKVLNDGTSGRKEPVWPIVAGATLKTGSLVLECQPDVGQGLDIIIGATAESDSTLQIESISWDKSIAKVKIFGGDNDDDSVLTVTITTQSGQVMVGVVLCSIQTEAPQLCVCR